MPTDSFTLSPAGPDVLIYDEGEGRTIQFKCRSGDATSIGVPAADVWQYQMPQWAHNRREVILERLRSTGAIVYETSQLLLSVVSPDGSFRVECTFEPDDRAPAWETLRIFKTPENRLLAALALYSFSQNVEFPEPGMAVIALEGRYGERHQLRVNVRRETFLLDADQAEQLLAALPQRLVDEHPRPVLSYSSIKPKRRPPWLLDAISAVIAPVFVAGGLFMCINGPAIRDRLIGLLGVVFFGAVAAASIQSLRKRRR